MSDERALLCVDMGTTRTRVWLTLGASIRAQTSGDFGVRDVSMGKDVSWLRGRLVDLLRTVTRDVDESPKAILAAGMITSNVGLREVPHVQAPAGVRELAASLAEDELELEPARVLPFLLVPGVRTGGIPISLRDALEIDLMRGEEILCVGLLAIGVLHANTVLLNLGSHWKSIWTNVDGQIVRSRTTLTGEMIHAVQTQTLLASSLPQEAPRTIDREWMQVGFEQAQRSGLSAALFGVRLLHLYSQSTAEQRLAFLYGAFIQTELSQMCEVASKELQILVVGAECVAEAWSRSANNAGIRCTVLQESKRQHAYLTGLRMLYESSALVS